MSASRADPAAAGTGSDGRGGGRVRRIEARLAERYGEPEKPRVDPLEELVHTILSQNTTDVNRDRAWDSLWEEFDGWAEVRDAPAARLEEAIRVAGLATQKAATIQGVLGRLEDEAGGPSLEHLREMGDDEALDYLAGFKGVGVKTAACVLCFSLRRPVIPVDTHVHRVARRLGLVPEGATRDAAHRVLNETVPPALRFRLHIHLIRHGRATCTARRPECGECVLEAMCAKVGVESAA